MPELNPTAASLLGFLHRGSMTGWDLARAVEGSIGYFWNVTRSQIYRELGRLEAWGLVVRGATGARDKRPFSITAEGRATFAAWLAREPGPELIRFPLLLTLFFGEYLDAGRLARFLAVHRVPHEQRLARYREFSAAVGDADQFVAATLRFGVAYEEAVLGWFDSLPWLATSAVAAERPRGSGDRKKGRRRRDGSPPRAKPRRGRKPRP